MTWQVAILGAGIGREHIAGYLELGDAFRVSHVCDLDVDRAQDLAAMAGAEALTKIDAVLANPGVDIVDICLPPSLHVPTSLLALEARKHVICEKPLAGSPQEARELRLAAGRVERHVFPVFQYRFGSAFKSLRALKEAGLLGRPRVASLETHWNRGADYYGVPWRGTWGYELGGAVLSHAIHAHDLLCHLFGPVQEVSASLGTLINPIETEDCAAIQMICANGALATSSITLGAADDTSRLKLVYEHLTAESGRLPYQPGQDDWTFLARDPRRQSDVDAVVRQSGHDAAHGFAGLFAAIARDLSEQCSTAPNLDDGVGSVELAAAIYRSHRTGQRVLLPMDPASEEFFGFTPSGEAGPVGQ